MSRIDLGKMLTSRYGWLDMALVGEVEYQLVEWKVSKPERASG